MDNKIDITQGENDRQVDESEQIRTGSIKLPNIKDIVMKDLPKTETEWLLIYALYASEEGTSAFTAEILRQLYHDSNRFTETRNKNFSTNLKKQLLLIGLLQLTILIMYYLRLEKKLLMRYFREL